MHLEVTIDGNRIILRPLAQDQWLNLEGVLKGTKVLEELEAEHREEIEKGE